MSGATHESDCGMKRQTVCLFPYWPVPVPCWGRLISRGYPRLPEVTREFPLEQAEGGFTSHHSFMVKYKAGQDLGLDMHTDDSDVTVNVCLGKDFRGAANQMRKTEAVVCPDEHSRRHPIRCVPAVFHRDPPPPCPSHPRGARSTRLWAAPQPCSWSHDAGAALTVCGDSRSPSHRQFFASYSHERGLAHVRLSSSPLTVEP